MRLMQSNQRSIDNAVIIMFNKIIGNVHRTCLVGGGPIADLPAIARQLVFTVLASVKSR